MSPGAANPAWGREIEFMSIIRMINGGCQSIFAWIFMSMNPPAHRISGAWRRTAGPGCVECGEVRPGCRPRSGTGRVCCGDRATHLITGQKNRRDASEEKHRGGCGGRGGIQRSQALRRRNRSSIPSPLASIAKACGSGMGVTSAHVFPTRRLSISTAGVVLEPF